jgi:PAS domain S-box-containing protein
MTEFEEGADGRSDRDVEDLLRPQRKLLARLMRSKALGTGDIAEALEQVTEIGARGLGVVRASVWRLDETGQRLECLDRFDRATGLHTRGAILLAGSNPSYFEALALERTIAAHDARTDPRTLALIEHPAELRSVGARLDAPIFLRGAMIGVIGHEQLVAPRQWQLWEELFAGTLADFLALVMDAADRARSARELDEYGQRLDAMVELRTLELQKSNDALRRELRERYMAEAAIRQSEESLRGLFAASPIPVVLTRLRDNVLMLANQRAADLFQFSADTMTGRRAPDFYVDINDRKWFLEQLDREGRVNGFEVLLQNSAHEQFWALLSAQKMMLEDEPVIMVGFQDVTPQRRAAAEIMEAKQSVERANQELTAAMRALQERDEVITLDLEHARELQRSTVVPPRQVPGVRIEIEYRPLELVGGDLYDIMVVDDSLIRVFIADAAGHGVVAALSTMFIRSEYEVAKREATTPGETLTVLNDRLTRAYGRMRLHFTALCMNIDLRRGLLEYACAAHPGPYIVHDGEAYELLTGGPFVGLEPDLDFEVFSAPFGRGDSVVLVTDGLSEASDALGQRFGDWRTLAAIVAGAAPPGEIVSSVRAHLAGFIGQGQPLQDDMTMVVVSWLKKGEQ